MRTAVLPLILLALVLPGVQAASPSFPELSIALFPEKLDLNASYEAREVTLDGIVTVNNLAGSNIDVSIVASLSAVWAATCTPNLFTVRGTGSVPFQMTITVHARACNMSVDAWVLGDARFNGNIVGTNQSQRTTILIGPLPQGPLDQSRDSSWISNTFGGTGAFSPTLAILIVVAVAVAVSGWGLASRRNKRRGAG